MRPRIRITMNKANLAQVIDAQHRALVMTADAVKTDVITEQVVPKDKGELERSMFIDDTNMRTGRVRIITDTPYARRLYYNPQYNFSTDANPNSRGLWFEEWISGLKKDFAAEVFKRFFRRLSRGIVK